MSGVLSGRVYELRVGVNGSPQGKIIANQQTGNSIRITFQIQKSTSDNPNTSEIRVYNLAPTTRAMLEKPDVVVQLFAGYAQATGLVLLHQGDVVFAYSRRQGPEVETILQLADGHKALRDTMVTLALRQGGKASDAVRLLAKQFGMGLSMPNGALDRTWQHGFSYSGLAKTAMRQITRSTGLEWSVQNGTIQVVNAGGTTSRPAIVLSPSSGMVESPERLREGSQNAAAVVDQDSPSTAKDVKYLTGLRLRFNGWRVKSLLMPMLNPADPIVLKSEAVSGQFRIDNVRQYGDSHGGEWVSHIECLSPNDYNVRQAADAQLAAKKAVSIARQQKKALKNA